MIVRIMSRGHSFSGLATYLTHDADQAHTADRVAWTHTHNCANDTVPGAVNEMLWTARDAELLKQEAGVRAGGRITENPVKHLSLNWAADQHPTQEHMIETADGFLRHMGWAEHQAIYVAHQDKHPHLHVMLNVIHPETGLRLDDGYEYRRAQAFALEYERTQGHIYCEQRLKNPAEREPSPPRNIWMAFQENEKEFSRSEDSLANNRVIVEDGEKNIKNSEWQILKEFQRTERMQFFSHGKLEFSQLRISIYREIREEFRGRWADYFSARRDGADPDTLAELKTRLVADQRELLEIRRDAACAELREARDGYYRELLDGQGETRAELRWRQEAGLDNALFLSELGERNPPGDIRDDFTAAAGEVTRPWDDGGFNTFDMPYDAAAEPDDGIALSGADETPNVGGGSGLFFFLDFLTYDLINLGSDPRANRPRSNSSARNQAVEARKQDEERQREEDDAAYRRRVTAPSGG